ncbi:MAG: rhodanese-like domain-containing protein, partial [Candidatus Nanopelagicales bacterium]
AVNIPLSLLPLRVSELPASKPLYVICQSGGRSMQASSWLARNGRRAVNVLGGTGSWVSSGKPVNRVAGT